MNETFSLKYWKVKFSVTDRDERKIKLIEMYLKLTKMLRNFSDEKQDPVFTQVVTLDLETVVSCVSGPKRPHDKVAVTEMKSDFLNCLTNKVSCVI